MPRFSPAARPRRSVWHTLPLLWLTQGTLILDTNVTSGGTSGYCSPQWILTLYMRFSCTLCIN